MKGRMLGKVCLIMFLILTLGAPSLAWGAKSAKEYVADGKSLAAQGKVDQAIEAFTQAIKLDPKLADAYFFRGGVYARKRPPDLNKAIADFGEAIRLNPRQPMGYHDRGVAYAQQGDFNRALVDLNDAIRLDPKMGVAYVTRAMVYMDKKEYDRARQDVDKAKSLGAKVPPALVDRLKQAPGKTR
jgi:tetratricopeptide (TPR) repeat protein